MMDSYPKYNGYNTKYLRDINSPSKPKTVVIYEPLLDMIPTEPDTFLTSSVWWCQEDA